MAPLCAYSQLDDPDCYETKPSIITENAQGSAQPYRKRTRKPAKSCIEEVVKVISVAELEPDEWVWKRYGRKKLADSLQRSYHRCAVKTCQVRRHVDRRDSDQNTYIVTYFGNHNHSPPTDSTPIRKKRKYVKIKKEEECWSS
ncbi:putative WRKY transcription factor 27 [Apium graveolens]|uniref:putative WRKY transcription factor 27 n=1 Tax=Apium graveolens TaxID=4045 RepID=UPI003D78F79D